MVLDGIRWYKCVPTLGASETIDFQTRDVKHWKMILKSQKDNRIQQVPIERTLGYVGIIAELGTDIPLEFRCRCRKVHRSTSFCTATHHAAAASTAGKIRKQQICITVITFVFIYLHLVGVPRSSEISQNLQKMFPVVCLKQYKNYLCKRLRQTAEPHCHSAFTQGAHGVPSGPLSHAFQWVRSLST